MKVREALTSGKESHMDRTLDALERVAEEVDRVQESTSEVEMLERASHRNYTIPLGRTVAAMSKGGWALKQYTDGLWVLKYLKGGGGVLLLNEDGELSVYNPFRSVTAYASLCVLALALFGLLTPYSLWPSLLVGAYALFSLGALLGALGVLTSPFFAKVFKRLPWHPGDCDLDLPTVIGTLEAAYRAGSEKMAEHRSEVRKRHAWVEGVLSGAITPPEMPQEEPMPRLVPPV